MNKQERQQLQATIAEVAGWVSLDTSVRTQRAQIANAGQDAVMHLFRTVVDVPRDGRRAWAVLPLGSNEHGHLVAMARQKHLPAVREQEHQALAQLPATVPAAIHDAQVLLDARRFFSGRAKKDTAARAAAFLFEYVTWGRRAGIPQILERIAPRWNEGQTLTAADALSDLVGLHPHLAQLGTPELIDASPAEGLLDAIHVIDRAVKDEAGFRKSAIDAGTKIRKAETRRMLATMPVERIKEATRDRLRITPLTDAGITTVLELLDYRYSLEKLPGIGPATASRILGAARTLEQTTFDEMPVRIDIKHRTKETTELLRRLGAWDAARKLKNATSDLQRAEELTELASTLTRRHTHLVVASSTPFSTQEFLAGVKTVISRAAQLCTTKSVTTTAQADPWDDFMARPADYFGMLSELGIITEDETKTHGDLPDDIVEAVRAMSLNTKHLTVSSLRGYQSFGARFALVQRKVILGDEMGLGKTVEALAVLAHLRSQGHHHALVICPAAVVTNWVREISSKSTLRAHRLHGPGRDGSLANWLRAGGVAVTTFETLAWLLPKVSQLGDLGCVVVDEAHYIKNPAAKRSLNAAAIMEHSERAVLLTGTPLENRLEEFANLVGYLQPKLVLDTSELSPRKFRQQVAPAYLRRNQEDVLTELPELVEVDEFVPFSTDDELAYRDAVAQGNFMAMRQAAMTQGHSSEKMRRLLEIVQEAEDNGRRVIVFSHFREVLNLVATVLPGKVFGPLTGSVPAVARQRMVDQFSKAGHGAVLVSQIVAGGVGLNIQAASVVVICEPQLKPTTEWQAIARARRMGQLESVQVHRLLSEEGVDQRVTEILARKRDLFDDFARVSATADSAPEAFDISEAELTRQVVAAERERLFATPTPEAGDGGHRLTAALRHPR